jgi:quercetin dioxygenase-like cupin family protein
MHYVGRSKDTRFALPALYEAHSHGYTHASLVDHTVGSVHTGLSLNALAPAGTIAHHVHSYEEGFYILEGRPAVTIDRQTHLLGPGDFGVMKVGTLHAWRNAGTTVVRWAQMAAPQPKAGDEMRDTFFQKDPAPFEEAEPLDPADPKGSLLGHFDATEIPAPDAARMGAGALPGVFLKWMIDEHLGARHHRMLFIEYQPGVSIGLHDHTFEEAYFVLQGEVQATLDGRPYVIEAGDVVWTAVGCIHSFANTSRLPVRWLETFSPQPPAENVFRFMAEWEQRAREIEG